MWMSTTAKVMRELKKFMECESNYDNYYMEIVRSFFTTIMILENAQPDCILADNLLAMIYKKAQGFLQSRKTMIMEYEDFENFMYEYLV